MRDDRRNDRNGPRRGGKRPFGDKKPWGGKSHDKPRGDRPFKKREDRDDRSREDRPWKKRDDRNDRPWKEKSDRPFKRRDENREERPWKKREERGDRPFKKREDRGDRPRGERPFRKREDRDGGERPFRKNNFEKRKFEKKFDKKKFDRPRRDERPRDDDAPREEQQRGPRPNLYGFHAVREAWLNPSRKIEALFLTEAGAAEFAATQKEAYEAGIERPSPTAMEKEKLERILQRNAVHQGIAAVAAPLDEVSVQDFIIKTQDKQKSVLLILDQVTDPHNVGAILRSACAFGADGVIMQRKYAPALEGVLAKSASGAVEHISVAYETNLSRTIEELKENGYFVFGLDERGEREVGDITRNNEDKTQKIALVLGAEGDGMRRLVKENCDELVKLTTHGALSSLNVSNAAAVALYAICK